MWLLAFALTSFAGSEPIELEHSKFGPAPDWPGEVCADKAVEVTSSSMLLFEAPFEADQLLGGNVILTLFGQTDCEHTISHVTLAIPTAGWESGRLPVSATYPTGKRVDYTRTIGTIDGVTLPSGYHELEVVVHGVSAVAIDKSVGAKVKLKGNLYRDFDGDGELEIELGGRDCEPFDAEVTGADPDYDDGLDNDCDGTIDNDDDRDGLNDALEVLYGLSPELGDSDSDGLADGLEWGSGESPRDTDGDGLPDALDTDSDGDGIGDSDEAGDKFDLRDSDGDGVPDVADSDDDNDGLDTINEEAGDCDNDGVLNHLDSDSDGDGIMDGMETDGDGDGAPDVCLAPAGDGRGTPSEPSSYGFGCNTSVGGVGLLSLLLLPLILRRRESDRG